MNALQSLVLLAGLLAVSARAAFAGGMVLEAGSGRVVSLAAPATSVFAANPKVVEVRPASPTSLFLFGVGPGRTTVAALSSTGRPIAQFEVTVGPSGYSAAAANSRLAQTLPGGEARAAPQGDGLALDGMVQTPRQAEQAASEARALLPPDAKLDNRLSVAGAAQVNLQVRVVEMDRNLTRELGVNWQALATLGGRYGTLGFSSIPALVTAATSSVGYHYTFPGSSGGTDINGVIDALAQDQLVRVLAEPNLTAMSGETASFLVGGEFPIPVAVFDNTISVEFKQYGVSLAFVPTVLEGGRISLHVRPEVSELTDQGAVQVQAGSSVIQIPALRVRRADTTVELGSGQSFAIAGLLQDTTHLTANGVPGLGDIPVLGALFRSDNFQRDQTELVILVTPYLVQPATSPAALAMPDDGWAPPGDLDRILLLRQKARGVASATRGPIPGEAGFIVQ